MTAHDWMHHFGTREGILDTSLGIVMKGALAGFAGTMALTDMRGPDAAAEVRHAAGEAPRMTRLNVAIPPDPNKDA